MHRLFICLLVFVCFCAASAAQDLSTQKRPKKSASVTPQTQVKNEAFIKRFMVNGGLHTEFFNYIQTDSSGSVRKFDTAPVLGFGIEAPLQNNFDFLSEVNWVLPRKSGGNVYKNVFMLRADAGYKPVDWFRLRVGTSLMWLNQHGTGGTEKIRNGNSTSTFYYPDENRSSINSTFDIGTEFLFDDWAVRLQTYTYAIFKEERRQFSYTLFVSYYWDN